MAGIIGKTHFFRGLNTYITRSHPYPLIFSLTPELHSMLMFFAKPQARRRSLSNGQIFLRSLTVPILKSVSIITGGTVSSELIGSGDERHAQIFQGGAPSVRLGLARPPLASLEPFSTHDEFPFFTVVMFRYMVDTVLRVKPSQSPRAKC
jgi:hypothetical protein